MPSKKQMVTVWPLTNDKIAELLNEKRAANLDLCRLAIDNYGLLLSQKSISDAEIAGVNIKGQGPYLLAWSPSFKKGGKDATMLYVNMSDVHTYQEAEQIFYQWRKNIEKDPNLWEDGFSLEKIRTKIRQLADKNGLNFFSALKYVF